MSPQHRVSPPERLVRRTNAVAWVSLLSIQFALPTDLSVIATPSVSPPDNEAVELPKPRPLPKTKKSDVAPENEAVNPPLAPKMKGKDQAIDKDEDQASNDGSSCTEEDTDHELSEYEHHPSEDEDLQEFKKKPTRLIKALTNEVHIYS